MEAGSFDTEVERALAVLQRGGVILYPTDTIWGLGCDATNEAAVQRIYKIKQRADSKSLIILLAEEKDILHYVAAPDPRVFDYIEEQSRPTTIIFEQALALPANVLAPDGSVAIRIVRDVFCRHLIKRLRRPLVSTSANISGQASPTCFTDISQNIKSSVDHIVQWRQDDLTPATASRIVKWKRDGSVEVIRN